jgi:D-lactate dehydrogenase
MDVFFYEAFEEEAAALKELLGTTVSFEMTDRTIQEEGHTLPPSKFISIRTQSVIPTSWNNHLDGILSRSTGYDHLKKYLASISQPLPCGYLEEYATHAVAEHAILMTMALLRRLPLQEKQFNTFHRDGLTGKESPGKKLLVVGVGRIGSEIVKIGSALGMNVRGVDIVQRHAHVQYVTREDGVAWADAIVCSMNLTAENHGYFSYDLLKKAAPGCIFINIARGEQAPLSDLHRLMTEQILGGVGLDVFEDEPAVAVALRTPDTRTSSLAETLRQLLLFPNVLCTPHNAFNTMEAVKRKSQFSVDEIFYFLQTKNFHNRVR